MAINAFTGSFCAIRIHFVPQHWEDCEMPELDEEQLDGQEYGSSIKRNAKNAIINVPVCSSVGFSLL